MPRNAKRKAINQGPAEAPEIPSGPPPPDPVTMGPAPGEQPFTRPSERPNEPVTAGSPTGPGPGPATAPQRARDAAVLFDAINRLPNPSPESRVAFLRARGTHRIQSARGV